MTDQTVGKNGVVITRRFSSETPAYRTYEVFQRERVGESTEKIKPKQLMSADYQVNPYPLLEILRENYPCYRDWLSNSYWITRYDDVTSIFADDANFETRSKAWYYDIEASGTDLRDELALTQVEEGVIDEYTENISRTLVSDMKDSGSSDLVTDFVVPLTSQLLAIQLALPQTDRSWFTETYWRMQRGISWLPELRQAGRQAITDLDGYFSSLIAARRAEPEDDLISAMLTIKGSALASRDVTLTLLEGDHETLHGGLANLWFLLLSHPQELEKARSERRLMKLAWLETLRHSPPVLTASRFAKHEVERFGRLLPAGARLLCSAAAANRDPRIFTEPDRFIVDREDLCQREPRGHYRADGLASGIAFGLGKPSKYPAIPEDRPRSRYAIVRDAAVTASTVLVTETSNLALIENANPMLTSLSVGEMHTCWQLPVSLH